MKNKNFFIRLLFFVLLLIIIVLIFSTVNNIVYSVTINENEQIIVLEKINEKRQEYGLDSLEFREDLNLIAKQKAEDLINNNYFAHESPTYGNISNMLDENDVNYNIAGENLAGVTTVDLAIDGWMNSEAHKSNILEAKYKYTGIYVVNSKTYGKIYVQIFLG